MRFYFCTMDYEQLPVVQPASPGKPVVPEDLGQQSSEQPPCPSHSPSAPSLPQASPNGGLRLQPEPVPGVPGLYMVKDAISEAAESCLLRTVHGLPWSSVLARKTQQYGFTYAYRAVKGQPLLQAAPPVPRVLREEAVAVVEAAFQALATSPAQEQGPQPARQAALTQVIVNHYAPGQGIAPHVDRPDAFGPHIGILSLGAQYPMQFHPPDAAVEDGGAATTVTVPMPRRSVLLLTGAARYLWRHSIPARREDDGRPRKPRVSITCRSVLPRATRGSGAAARASGALQLAMTSFLSASTRPTR